MSYTIRDMLRSQMSLNQAESAYRQGLVEERAMDWFYLLSDWAAPRFSGSAGIKQERFWNRLGKEAYWRRIERIKALHDRIKG